MKQFVIVPRKLGEIKSKNKFLNIAVYFTIRRFIDNRIALISYEKIKERLHISDRDIKTAITELKENNLIDYRQYKSKVNKYVYNRYYFDKKNDTPFEIIDVSLLDKKLKAKQIGLLIYMKLNSFSNWYNFKDYTDLGNKLGVTRQTASKYMKELSEYFETSKVGGVKFVSEIFTDKSDKFDKHDKQIIIL